MNEPSRMNRNTNVAETPVGMPKIACVVRNMWSRKISGVGDLIVNG